MALFLDAVFLPVRPDGPKEGVLVAWGFTEEGERVLLSVMLGMRESHEDWLALGRDLIARGLGAPLLDRRRRRARADQGGRAVLAGLRPPALLLCIACATCSRSCPSESASACAAPTGRRSTRPINEHDGKQRLQALVGELDQAGYTAAAKCLADDLDALVVHLRYPTTSPPRAGARRTCSSDRSARSSGAPR